MAPAQNLIFIMLDSFRQDHVSIYNHGEVVFTGIPPCQTPNIDKFAKECIIFENVYPCGLPTMPVRYELMTGQFSLPFR
ncbi:sulfatase, partial [candidate division KSB1 bacterium]